MKKTFKQFFLGSICVVAITLPAMAQQFVDCSSEDGSCDVLYASEDVFTGANLPVKSVDKALGVSGPMNVLPSGSTWGKSAAKGVMLPVGATQTSNPNNYLPGTVQVPGRQVDSHVEVLPDGSVRTTTVEVTTTPNASGYEEKTRRVERVDAEKTGAIWVSKSLSEKVEYGEGIHDWEAPRGETLRSLLMQWGEASGWTVVWKMGQDYKLEAGVVFRGTFTEVASAIIRTFARAVPAPIGTFYKGNRVLVINIQEDENAH